MGKMVGQSTYTRDQVEFLLTRFADLKKGKTDKNTIIKEYYEKYKKTLTDTQLRYVKNKYGKDPSFGTPLINEPMRAKRRALLADKSSPEREVKRRKKEHPQSKRESPKDESHIPEAAPVVLPPVAMMDWPNQPPPDLGIQQQQRQQQPQQQPQLQAPIGYCNSPLPMQYPAQMPYNFSPSITAPGLAPQTPLQPQGGQQLPHSHHNQMNHLWDYNGSPLGHFNLGNNHSPAAPYTPQPNHAVHSQPRSDLLFPMNPPNQMMASPYPYQPAVQTPQNMPLLPAPDYGQLLLNRPPEDFLHPNNLSPAVAQPDALELSQEPPQESPIPQVKAPYGQVPQLFDPRQFVPVPLEQTTQPSLAEPRPVPNAANAPCPHPPNPPSNASQVVSYQTSGGPQQAPDQTLHDALTANLDPFFFVSANDSTRSGGDCGQASSSAANAAADQEREVLETLYPSVQRSVAPVDENENESIPVPDDTIDPKLLAEMCSLPLLQRGLTRTPSEEPKTPVAGVKLEERC
ncbi:hypothetical protein B0T10DRAFT_570750, partial [Thelonectria olida]